MDGAFVVGLSALPPDTAFNKMYRARRLAAMRLGCKFPPYRKAKRQLDQARKAALAKGEVEVDDFWNIVFRVGG